MQKWQGKPVIAWSIVLGLWAAIRLMPYPIATLNIPKSPGSMPMRPLIRVPNTIAFIPAASAQQAILQKAYEKPETAQDYLAVMFKARYSSSSLVTSVVSTEATGHKIGGSPALSAVQTTHSFTVPAFAVQTKPNAASPAPLLQSPLLYPIRSNTQKRFSAYAYSFIRPGALETNALVSAAPQYGGGQSGVIATYRLVGSMRRNVSLLGRASLAHGAQGAPEFATGLRIKPLGNIPVTLSAEHRLRANQQDVTALYAAGSIEDIKLPAQFMAQSYAQAGLILGRQSNQFYDAGMRIDRAVIKTAIGQINVGLGGWAGGQQGGGRLDIGPALRTEVMLGSTARVNITADWRFRIAGNAKPGNGPTITISTGF